jgi:hypothetical protein
MQWQGIPKHGVTDRNLARITLALQVPVTMERLSPSIEFVNQAGSPSHNRYFKGTFLRCGAGGALNFTGYGTGTLTTSTARSVSLLVRSTAAIVGELVELWLTCGQPR